MPVAIGSQLGSLDIVGLLGKGGMGEVYRARDTRLRRDVAIKILPEEFSLDSDRVSRFQREAEVLASLNHSNIATIYDLRESDGLRYLVLELVEGDTLADLIRRGPLAVDEALTIAIGICEAMEAAHEKGVIHRDLKPANVKVTPDGQVKVLDFGLAKPSEPARGSALSDSPTLLNGTAVGMILGTAAYMSPEQARGRLVDTRSDVFAFGCVLYEMLTGTQAFAGDDVSDVLASVIKSDVDVTRLPAHVNARLRELLQRCLEKDRRNRWHAIGDVRFELESIRRAGTAEIAPAGGARRPQRYLVAAIVVLALSSLGFATLYWRSEPLSSEPIHLSIVAPDGTTFGDNPARAAAAVSPDGHYVAFATSERGSSRLWLRSLHAGDARAVEGSEGARAPFWSPDSQAVAFFSNRSLLRVDVRGGKPQVITTLDTNNAGRASGTWNADGSILFGLDTFRPIYRVAAAGGNVAEATVLAPGDRGHYRPVFLPDRRHFLFVTQARDRADAGIFLGSLDSKETRRILAVTGSSVAYSPTGHLLFVRGGSLFAQRFDVKTFDVRDQPIKIADSVFGVGSLGSFSAFSVSETGVLAYRTADASAVRPESQLTWFSREGKVLSTLGPPGLQNSPRLSPDGTRVAVATAGTTWILGPGEIATQVAENSVQPIWSSDGRRLVYSLRMPRTRSQVAQRGVGAADGERILLGEADSPEDVNDLSPDGKFVVGTTVSGQTNRDLIAVPLDGSGPPLPIAATPAQELYGRLSPDGHWIAFASDATGVFDVYVQSFPRAGSKILVSRNGGGWPVWRRDGKELFYIAPDSRLMAVDVSLANGFEPGAPRPLFEVSFGGEGLGTPSKYDVSADGQRFLVNVRAGNFHVSPIHIVLNWTTLLTR